MTETGWAAFLDEQRAEETPAQKMARLAHQGADRQEREELRAEAERAIALDEAQGQRALAFHQAGIAGRSTADVFADAGRLGDEDAELAEAQKTIQRIERRRERRANAMRYQAEQLASVQRSAVPDDPFEAASRRAHETFRAMTRAKMAEAVTGTPQRARRPFGGRGIARSEQPESCPDCLAMGASPEEAFAIHHPELLKESTGQAERPEQTEYRSGQRGYGREIRR